MLEELVYGDIGEAVALDGIGFALYAVAELGDERRTSKYILPYVETPALASP